MTIFALGVPCLVKLIFFNLTWTVAFKWISSLQVVQNSKHSYTFIRKLLQFGVSKRSKIGVTNVALRCETKLIARQMSHGPHSSKARWGHCRQISGKLSACANSGFWALSFPAHQEPGYEATQIPEPSPPPQSHQNTHPAASVAGMISLPWYYRFTDVNLREKEVGSKTTDCYTV